MNNLFYNAVIKFANGTNNYTDDPEQAKEDMRIVISRIADYLVWGFLAVGVILCIFIGFKFAMAKTPEDKKACKDRLIWFIIGTAIVLGAGIVWTIIKNVVVLD